MSKRYQIRNSTTELLIFQIENKEEDIEVLYQDETLWLTQKAMPSLSDVSVPTVKQHLKNIYGQGVLQAEATIKKNAIVQQEENRQVSRHIDSYNLAMVYLCTSTICHSWVCHRKKTNGI